MAQLAAMVSSTTMEISNQPQLTSQLTQMKRQPFGTLEDGTAVEEIRGFLIVMAVDYMKETIAERTLAPLPPETPPEEAQKLAQDAQVEALERLVKMLNAAIPDERYHVTIGDILDEGNNFTTEFWLFAVDYCRVISGDPEFFSNYTKDRIPPVIARLFRPFSTYRTFRLLQSSVVKKFSRADLRVIEATPTSARLRWYGRRQDDPILNELHLTLSSLTWKNTLSSIPQLHGQPKATVVERRSMLEGSDYYEWEFRWQESGSTYGRWLLFGGIAALALLVFQLWVGIPTPVLLVLAVLSPVLLGWSVDRVNKLVYEHNQKEILLQEQRSLAEEQFDQSQQAKARLQSLNVNLSRKVDEFTTLHDISVAVSATLDLDDLIQRSLIAVTTHLYFDRALVLLVDEHRRTLTHGQGVGGSQELRELVASFEFSLDETENYFIGLLNSDGPIRITEITQDRSSINFQIAEALGTSEHLGSPLVSKGRRLGVLIVDNSLSMRPITDEDVELISVVAGQIAVAVDNALLYKEVESQKHTLEQRVAKRTEELAKATAEAQEARTIAEEANRAKSAFLSNVSHELRTPLTSILGFAKVIRRSMDHYILPNVQANNPRTERATKNVEENLGIIIDEGNRLTSLINNVLDLAKIEAGKVEWEMRPVQIATVIDRALASTNTLMEQKRLQPVREVDGDLPNVIGDSDQLMQVIINLISNAVKFTPKGTIICRAARIEDEVIVSVSDTGIGITEEDLPQIFDMFKQVGDTLTDKPRGSGLGLAISKEIIDLHGGRIWAESQSGKGSAFSFALPIFDTQHLRPAEIDHSELMAYLSRPWPSEPKRQKTILIVDDEESIRKYLFQELSSDDCRILGAASGQHALALLEEEQPELIIMDVLMPEMDGYRTLAAIRKKPSMINVPAIVLSVFEEEGGGHGLGVKQFMSKPIDTQALLSQIENLLAAEAAPSTVLLVDDRPSRAVELAEALRARGFQTSLSEDLTPLRSKPTDIVLVSASATERNGLLDKPDYHKALAHGLIMVYR